MGRFFWLFLLPCGMLFTSQAAIADHCPADRIDQYASVGHVYDGDTVRLTDGRKIRLIGIDTPEIDHDGAHSEPMSRLARSALEALIGKNPRVGLRFDQERKDRHGRTLAHLFLENGVNLQEVLLAKGLATTLVVPPNTWSHTCYRRMENMARGVPIGIWRLPRYQVIPAESLSGRERGFRIIAGTVRDLSESRNNLWLDLTRQLALRIKKQDLRYFASPAPGDLQGRRIEARGWLQSRGGQLRMRIRHPAALFVAPDTTP